jgi:hypothetical protein
MKLISKFVALFGAAGSMCITAPAATLFLGAYPNFVIVFDEASGKVTDKITLTTGLPRSLRLSADKKLIYVTTLDHTGIEVLDVATKKIVNKFVLDNGNVRYRFAYGLVPDPTNKVLYTALTQLEKKIDRWDIGLPKYTVIDTATGKITKTVDIPAADRSSLRGDARGAGLQISPDGKYLYQFRDRISIVDTTDFKEVDKINLTKADFDGEAMENVGFGATFDSYTEPGQHVALFTSADPYVHNRLFGLARFNLNTRNINFTPIGPAPQGMSGLQVTPDGKKAYTVIQSGAQGNKRCEFWAFDMATNKISQTLEVPCRARFSFGMSGDGKKLYLYAAGFEIEVYDAATLKYERTWDMGNDLTGPMVVVQ